MRELEDNSEEVLDLESQQTRVLQELEELNNRIEAIIQEFLGTEKTNSPTEVESGPAENGSGSEPLTEAA